MSEDQVDFSKLLDVDAAEAVRPPPLPAGTYRALIKENQGTLSAKKGTPGIEFTFSELEPMADVDSERWQAYIDSPAVDKNLITLTETFWLSRKALYRLKEFCEAAGAEPVGKLSKMVADAMHNRVLLTVAQSVSGGNVYSNIVGYAKDE